MAPQDDEPVQRLPRGRMFRLTMPQVMRIVMTLAILVMVIIIQRPCAENVSKFVTGFDQGSGSGSGSGSAALQVDDTVYEPINADMTPAQIQAAMDRARARAAAQQGSAVGSGSALGSGSAAP